VIRCRVDKVSSGLVVEIVLLICADGDNIGGDVAQGQGGHADYL
jgi:hypothetical protein